MEYGSEPDRGPHGPPAAPETAGWWFVGTAYLVVISAGWFALANPNPDFFTGPVLAVLAARFLAPIVAAALLAVGLSLMHLVWPDVHRAPFALAAWGLVVTAGGLEATVVAALAASNGFVVAAALLLAGGLVVLLVATWRDLRGDADAGPDAGRPALAIALFAAVALVALVPIVDGIAALDHEVIADVSYQTSTPSLFGGYEWSTSTLACGTVRDPRGELRSGSGESGDEVSACQGAVARMWARISAEVIGGLAVLVTGSVLLVLAVGRVVRPWHHRRRGDRSPTRRSSRRTPTTA